VRGVMTWAERRTTSLMPSRRWKKPLLIERLKAIQHELAEIDSAREMAAEVVTAPLSEEDTRDLITRKLADLDAALKGDQRL